jgi:cell division protein FtsZ
LDQIARYANAVITFDNDRMGELIVPKDGVAQAFAAADKIISQSIRATMNVVFRPGIIRIGMDDLLSALDADDSRCLFGYGVAKGDNRSHEALEQALKCPLLDRGKLLTDARSVLVQVAGGDTMTLFEVQLVMEEVAKHVGKQTQILFGTGTDKRLGNSLTVTIISSITGPAASSMRAAQEEEAAAPSISLGMPALAEIPERTQPISPLASIPVSAPAVAFTQEPEPELEADALAEENSVFEPEPTNDSSVFEPLEDFEVPFVEDEPIVPAYAPDPVPPLHRAPVFQADPEDGSDLVNPIARAMGGTPEHGFGSPPPFPPQSSGNEVGRVEALTESSQKITLSRVFGSGGTGRIKTRDPLAPALDGPVLPTGKPHEELDAELTSLEARQQQEMLKLDPVAGRGRFAKTDPTIVDGEDLDVPTFLRKKK